MPPPIPPRVTLLPLAPKFSGNYVNHLHPSSPHHPPLIFLAFQLNGCPLSKQTPFLFFFLMLPPLHHCSKCPQDFSPLLQTHKSFSKLRLLPSTLFRLFGTHRDVKYSQLLLRSGSTATRLSGQTEELWTCEAKGVRFIWGPLQVGQIPMQSKQKPHPAPHRVPQQTKH